MAAIPKEKLTAKYIIQFDISIMENVHRFLVSVISRFSLIFVIGSAQFWVKMSNHMENRYMN